MELRTMLMASCALALIGTTAMADCDADLARLQTGADAGQGGGISKDGSLAPLEMPDAASGNAASSAPAATTEDNATAASSDAATGGDTSNTGEEGNGGIAKDGSLAPLEGSEGGTDTPIAMSGQDAQAQQDGQPTAAESAEGVAATPSDRSALMAEAQAALDAGDEDACRAAIQKIDAL